MSVSDRPLAKRMRLVAVVATVLLIGLAVYFLGGRSQVASVPQGNTAGPYSLVVDASAAVQGPSISQPSAEQIAITTLTGLKTDPITVRNYAVKGDAYHSGVTAVTAAAGGQFYNTSTPENDYVVYVVAPPQQGFRRIEGVVVVNGDTGKVEAYAHEVLP